MYIFPSPADLTALGWQPGDQITYDCGSGGTAIGGLTCGATYYAIVYIPGYSEKALVKANDVSNCALSGFQDDRCPTTSVWLSNTAFCNGPTGSENYIIDWKGEPNIAKGSDKRYPKPRYYTQNISITCCDD
jgi:hypothetical protein